jgi:SAM-dependent methyltransferase
MSSIPTADSSVVMIDRSCPFCDGASEHLFDVGDRNRLSTGETFSYDRCGRCGTVFMVDPPKDLSRYYEGDYYHFDADLEPVWKRHPLRLASASYRVAMVRDRVASGHLIEVGAGTGAFAVTAQEAGFDVSAIEMDENCCRYLNEQGIRTVCSDDPVAALAALPRARVVAMWHVLEHLSNPAEVLECIAGKLEPGGILAIGVPNVRSLQFRLLGSRWPHIDAPRHLCLMPADALVARGQELGMSLVASTTTDPEGLDFDLFGWVNALRRNPAQGSASPLVARAALALRRVVAPFERTGGRGSAVTLLLCKGAATA